MKFTVVLLYVLLTFLGSPAQTLQQKEKTAKQVFDNIVVSCGNPRSAPKLVIIPGRDHNEVIARYRSESACIEIDEKLIDICLSFQADSLNALAIIFGHELAHFYRKHNFCHDLAYAAKKNSMLHNNSRIYGGSYEFREGDEKDADVFGTFYTVAAGYNPFGIFKKMLTKIYKEYELQDKNKNYPSKSVRINLNVAAQQEALELLTVFNTGKMLIYCEKYNEAVLCFRFVNNRFESRENYNNSGIAYLLEALSHKTESFREYIYPIEPDPVSRLKREGTRGIPDKTLFKKYLDYAKDEFKSAVNKDKNYAEGYINLAYISLLNENPMVALQEYLPDIPAEDTIKYSDKINLIKAIAFVNQNDTASAETYFNMLPAGKDSIIDYNRNLFNSKIDLTGNKSRSYREAWLKRNHFSQTASKEQLDMLSKVNFQNSVLLESGIVDEQNRISIFVKNDNNNIKVILNDKLLLTAVRYDSSGIWLVKPAETGSKENDKQAIVIKL